MADAETEVDVKALQQELETLRPLSAQVENLKLELSKGTEVLKTVVTARDTLQSRLQGSEKQLADLTKQVADLLPLKDAHSKLLASFTSRVQTSLKSSNITDELIKDKTLEQLLTMEETVKAVAPAKDTVESKGLGLGGGSGASGSSGSVLDDMSKLVQKAKERAGVK